MKEVVADETFKSEIKQKLIKWVTEQFKGWPEGLPEIEILEISKYPLRRLVLRAEAQTRSLTKFKKPGAATSGTQDLARNTAVDVWSVETEKIDGFINDKKLIEIPSSLESASCRHCGGTGRLTCSDCQGQKTVFCSACRGDGFIVCPKCRRTLKINCPACEGRGKVYSNSQQAYVDCAQCDGKGSFPCKECAGGRNPCSECGGQGRIPCLKCGQTGGLECRLCEGKGNIVTGSSVEITSFPLEAKLDLLNDEIPKDIANGEFPAVSYDVERTLQIEGQPVTAAEPDELLGQIETLRKKLSAPPEARIIKSEVTLEVRPFFNLRYRAGSKDGSVWFLTAGEKFIIEKSFLNELHFEIIGTLETKLENGDAAGARRIIKGIENIPALRKEAENISRKLARGILPAYAAGGIIGSAVSCAGLIAYEAGIWKTSFHLYPGIVFSVIGILAVAAASVAVINKVAPPFIDTRSKRIAAGAVPPIAIAVFFLFICAVLGFNPVKYMDAKQMQREYSAYFPFGQRTLAAKEDVEFLERLVEKYEPTGIDLSSVRNDLSALQAKLRSDVKAVEKLEQTARDIAQVSENRKKLQKKTYRRRPKIYVR